MDLETVLGLFHSREAWEDACNRRLSEKDILGMLDKREINLYFVDGNPAGIIALEHTEAPDIRNFGYMLRPAYRGKGLGAAMVRDAIRYARDVLNLRWLYAYAARENRVSCHILESQGFHLCAESPVFLDSEGGEGALIRLCTYTKRLFEEEP